jgi:hypothetical protein
MKPCLDDNEMLHRLAAEDGEPATSRAHLVECPRCAARFDDLAREAAAITNALSAAADSLRPSRSSTAIARGHAHIGGGFRSAAILSGAAAFGGVAAFALLLALGWRPPPAQKQLANAGANGFATFVDATARGNASRRETIAAGEPDTSPITNRTLYSAELITGDPLAGIAYGESAPASDSYEDMLFCVPGEDSALCSASTEQG